MIRDFRELMEAAADETETLGAIIAVDRIRQISDSVQDRRGHSSFSWNHTRKRIHDR